MSVLLSADQINAADDLAYVDESVPEWKDAEGKPGVVRLRQMPANDGMELSAEMDIQANVRDGMYVILVYCAVDENNNRLYPTPPRTDPTYNDIMQGHITKLKRKSMFVLNRLQKTCLKLNGMSKDGGVALKKD